MTILDLLAQKARVAALVAGACAVTGLASAAALSPTTFSPVDSETDVVATASPSVSPSDTPSASPEASESPSPEASDSAEPEATPTAAATPDASPVACPTDVANHGAYVSGVARDKSTTGREHGKAVSEAAHSDCGKTGAGDTTDSTESTDAADSEDSSDSEDGSGDAESSTTGSGHGKGHGKKGHGHH